MADIRIGTSSFTATGWQGSFYPNGLRPADYLTYYAEYFDTVEIDSTFYATPNVSVVRSWNAKTPEGFVFAAKVPQLCGDRIYVVHGSNIHPWQDVAQFERYISLVAGQFPITPLPGHWHHLLYQMVVDFETGQGVAGRAGLVFWGLSAKRFWRNTMNLLILNGPRDPRAAKYPQYRGTYRAHPTYLDSASRDHEINQLFFWFLEEGGELGLVHDPPKALRYAELLNERIDKSKPFEVVEVTKGNAPPLAGVEFLGFDLSAGYNNSLLWWWGLEPQMAGDAVPGPVREVGNLIYRYYGPQRNQYGLFKELQVTSECLQSMDALQQLSPNLYEGENLKPSFEAVGLYLLR
jgi:hypothetical protein